MLITGVTDNMTSVFFITILDNAYYEVIIMENNTANTRVAVISIIVENTDSVTKINEILHSASEHIIGRMGLPYRQKNISIISVVIDAGLNVISSVSGRLGKLPGVTVKTAYSNAKS